MSNDWPATVKQKAYGRALEEKLRLEESPWNLMTVDEAKERISELVKLKEEHIKEHGAYLATEAQISYGVGLEDGMNLPISDWRNMTIDEAKERISMLVLAKEVHQDNKPGKYDALFNQGQWREA